MDAAIIAEVTGTDCHIAPFDLNETMSTPITSQNLKQGEKEQAASVSYLGSDSAFLVLAPVLSSSFPTAPLQSAIGTTTDPSTSSTSISTSSVISDPSPPAVDIPAVTDIEATFKNRRSSSVSSSSSGQKRYLKLGPVHWGGDGAPDFVEVEE